MKKLLILVLLLTTGCQSFHANQAIKPEDRQFSGKIPNLSFYKQLCIRSF